jgi:hypothetical protein
VSPEDFAAVTAMWLLTLVVMEQTV